MRIVSSCRPSDKGISRNHLKEIDKLRDIPLRPLPYLRLLSSASCLRNSIRIPLKSPFRSGPGTLDRKLGNRISRTWTDVVASVVARSDSLSWLSQFDTFFVADEDRRRRPLSPTTFSFTAFLPFLNCFVRFVRVLR